MYRGSGNTEYIDMIGEDDFVWEHDMIDNI